MTLLFPASTALCSLFSLFLWVGNERRENPHVKFISEGCLRGRFKELHRPTHPSITDLQSCLVHKLTRTRALVDLRRRCTVPAFYSSRLAFSIDPYFTGPHLFCPKTGLSFPYTSFKQNYKFCISARQDRGHVLERIIIRND